MRLTIVKTAFAALMPIALFAGPAVADEQHDKLMQLCQKNEPQPETCECQVKALEAHMDPKVLKVFIAIGESEEAGSPEEAEKASQAALAEAGMTEEEFATAMMEAGEKVGPAMEACKAS